MTAIEYKILENLPKKYKYMARDSYGDLKVSTVPLKRTIFKCGSCEDITWEFTDEDLNEDENTCELPYPHLFEYVQWENAEMSLIEDIKEIVKVNGNEYGNDESPEKELLLELPDEYKYIVRDADGELEICDVPYKEKYLGMWIEVETDNFLDVSGMPYKELFQQVKWEDDKPWLISDLVAHL